MELIKIENNNQNRNINKRPSAPKGESTARRTTKQNTNKGNRPVGVKILFGFMRVIAICICIGVIAASVIAVLLSMWVVKETAGDGALLDLDNLKLSFTTTIYALGEPTEAHPDGEYVEYQRLVGDENRMWIDLNNIPENLQNAFICTEDKEFWTHSGFSIKRTVFAGLNELAFRLTGKYLGTGTKQGASTIHQQLIKNISGDEEQDYMRKIREIFRAIALDGKYSKDIILEAYLNTIGLTGNIAGVQTGAHTYFNKELNELTLAECASIAAITKDPTEYHPMQNPENHIKRRNTMLWFMFDQGKITQAEYDEAVAAPLVMTEKKTQFAQKTYNSYATDKVIEDVLNDMQTQLGMTADQAFQSFYNDGYQIYSTIRPKMQTELEKIMIERSTYPEYEIEVEKKDKKTNQVIMGADGKPEKEKISTQGAMVSLNYKGELCAVVGGFGEKTGDRVLNRADSKRATGSTFKGVTVYPLAFELGLINYSSTRMDSPFKIIKDEKTGQDREWPQNYSKSYSNAQVTVEQAIRQSLNTIAVRIGDECTPRALFDFAYDTLQIKSLSMEKGDCDLAPMCLGALSVGMTPYELAGAYLMYGNKGEYITPHSYTSVVNSRGEVVLEPDVVKVQAISEETAYIMNRLLYTVLGTGGTAPGLRTTTTDSIGKTGTTNETKDVWFVGLTPNYVTSCWFGYDSNEPLNNGKYDAGKVKHPGASAWKKFMDTIQEGTTNKDFAVSENVTVMPFCKVSGATPGPLCTEVGNGYYVKGEVLGTCPIHIA